MALARRAFKAPETPPPASAGEDAPVPQPPRGDPQAWLPSGSTLLDCVLGGGWRRGRMVNLVGDRSSGKTLLAIEACANQALLFGAESIRYVEPEAAFDHDYARTIGMPEGVELANDVGTVEQLFDDLTEWLAARKKGDPPSLYVLDSSDALSDEEEMKRDIDKGTYGQGKAKKFSEMFRRLITPIAEKNCTLFIVSQLRDKIGVTFGETKTRAGGKALDFYASQIVWLAEIAKIKRTIYGQDRVVGTEIKARTKKNKVGPPFRQAEMQILFNYGVDDESSMLEWLRQAKATNLLAMDDKAMAREIAKCRERGEADALADLRADLQAAVLSHWAKIEDALRPTISKYGRVA